MQMINALVKTHTQHQSKRHIQFLTSVRILGPPK